MDEAEDDDESEKEASRRHPWHENEDETSNLPKGGLLGAILGAKGEKGEGGKGKDRGKGRDGKGKNGEGKPRLPDTLEEQIDYYFSDQNLRKDAFLRDKLGGGDLTGWVDVSIIATFPIVKSYVYFNSNLARIFSTF